jgi:signal transduction histidine kinase
VRKLQEGRLLVRKSPELVYRLLEPIVREYELVAERASRSLDVQVNPKDETKVPLDREIMDRVVRNLLWNAIKYSTRNSSIQVAITPLPDSVELHVRNHCERIPEDQQAQLFEAFGTGKQATEPGQFHSIGLGLAFCKVAAEAHGGHIRLESPCPAYETEDGVEFTVSLPR